MTKYNNTRQNNAKENITARKRDILKETQRQERRRSLLIQAAVATVLVALIAGIGTAFALRKSTTDAAGSQPPIIAAAELAGKDPALKLDIAHTPEGGIKIGRPGAKVSILAYEDFQCPICKEFEDNSGAAIATMVEAGLATVEYRPIAFLDDMSSTGYSTRAANAAWSVAESDVTKWPAMHKALFAQQPAEYTAGLTDGRLAEIAKSSGAPDGARDAIHSGRFRGYVQHTTQKNLPIGGTPTVRVNDRTLNTRELMDPKRLTEIVTAAANAPN